MKFMDFVKPAAIRPQLDSTDKQGAIRELISALVEAGEVAQDDHEDIVQGILKREELGSTGIGRGVAVPHAKHDRVDQPVGTIGISQQGIGFNSLDGEDVYLMFLLVSPMKNPTDHLRALENISRQLREDTFCRFLKQSKTLDEVQQLLEEADENSPE